VVWLAGCARARSRTVPIRLLYLTIIRVVGWRQLLSRGRHRRTPGSWSSATKSPSCAARSPSPGSTGPTGRSWPRWPACCQPGCAATAWSRQERCWPGTAASSSAGGPTPASPAARQPARRSETWSCAWHGRILPGDTAACTARSPGSATTSARQPSGGSSALHAGQRPAARTPPGGHSCTLRRTGFRPATSSTLTQSSCAACVSCSSWKRSPGTCTSSASPNIRWRLDRSAGPQPDHGPQPEDRLLPLPYPGP
jgi:hypothetical protein